MGGDGERGRMRVLFLGRGFGGFIYFLILFVLFLIFDLVIKFRSRV